jgi:hypothetical protein
MIAQSNQNKMKFLRFSSIFVKITLKNNVCVNLNTKTSKYRVDVNQLARQYYPGFLLRLFWKQIMKNSYFEFGVEIEKAAPLEFLFVSSNLLQKFERIFKFNLGGDRFAVENV